MEDFMEEEASELGMQSCEGSDSKPKKIGWEPSSLFWAASLPPLPHLSSLPLPSFPNPLSLLSFLFPLFLLLVLILLFLLLVLFFSLLLPTLLPSSCPL